MKSLLSGCAAAALFMALAVQAHAQTVVRDSPVHAVPMDADDAPAADTAAPAVKAEPAPVRALTQPKAPTTPALTPEENAFFAALGQRVTDAASAYETYVRRAGAIDPAFNNASSVHRAVQLGAAYHPQQLDEGIVAYAALIALRNPEFVDGVRAVQNSAFADGLAQHPERVMQVRGAAAAAADAAGVLRSQGEALITAGKAATKAAYDIQAQSWSKSPVTDPNGVLDEAKTSGGEMRTATVPSKEKLLDSLAATPAPQAGDASAAPAPDVVRGVALAALAILGRTGDGQEAQFEALLDDPASLQCLKMAKLNLNQCLAVAGPQYEDAYCAGRHAVSDTGKCVATAAGGDPALDAGPQPRLQDADAVGPEQASVYGKAAPKDDDDDDAPADQPAPALATAPAPLPAPAAAPRQYAEAPAPRPALQPAPAPAYTPPQTYSYAQNSYPQNSYPQNSYPPNSYPQNSPPQGSYPQNSYPQNNYPPPNTYAQNSYAPQPAPPAAYRRPAYQAYPQPQYQPQPYQQQPYPQPYPQQQYAPQPYQQPYAQSYAPNYGGQQPYYPPQQQGYPAYQSGGYYGR
jgi:hypothetical protein